MIQRSYDEKSWQEKKRQKVAIQLKYFDKSDLSKIVHEYKNISTYESTQRFATISINNSESQIAIKQLVNDARCEIILHDLIKT